MNSSRNLQWTKGYPLINLDPKNKNIYINKDTKFSHTYYGSDKCCLTCKSAGASVYKLRGMCEDSYLGLTSSKVID